ncbi:MAG: LAGLIDADG family homing endonuclease [Candidatus Omnitrophota bacterium]|nr:LAGLIDADG family homing endonuclease [Candidatus Omnitrophota bacterium]
MAEQIKNKRVKFPKGKQRLFIASVHKKLKFGWDKIANIFNINRRTLSDWCRERSTMNYKVLLDLHINYNISIPKEIKILPQFWYVNRAAKLGALMRNKLYGNFGTPEGRRKGGFTTIRKFMHNPELAKKLGLRIIKDIIRPKRGLQLAEFVGIVLGDGGLTDYQLKITFNRDTDAEHADFVKELIKKLFKLTPKIISKKLDKGSDIAVYSKNLVEFLESNGLKRGNKVKNKVDIPFWIKRNNKFQLACLRGLMDTDGSCYAYSHNVNKKRYHNVALCFTNASEPLLKSVYSIFDRNGYYPCITGRRVYVYGKNEIKKYFQKVGTHNPKHLGNYKRFRFLKNKKD